MKISPVSVDALTIASTGAATFSSTTLHAGVATFQKQTLSSFGPTITASITLALPLCNLYLINSASAATITLPTNSATYAGSQIYFRRSGGATTNIYTFNQTGGAAVFMSIFGVTLAASNTLAASTYVTSFISDGTIWYQMKSQ